MLCGFMMIAVLLPGAVGAQDNAVDPMKIPAVKTFLASGFGEQHDKAPKEVEQFGRLVGLWLVETEMAAQDGSWVKSAPGIWAWKYAIGGFAVSDLFYQGADNLPRYMANLGRDYLLTANRVYAVADKKWQVAWMANGAGKVMGADYGTFTATLQDGEIVMESPPGGFGLQRVVFYEIGDDAFRWRSDYSQDKGESWKTVMRMHARRHAR
jgi:hypothetical protein